MKKTAIRKAVIDKVDDKIRKAIDDEAESLARQRVWEALHPPSKFFDAPTQSLPTEPASKSRVFASNDPKLTGGQ